MAKKYLSDKPTSTSDYAWSFYKTYTRKGFTSVYKLGVSSAVVTIGTTIAGMLPKYGWLVSIVNAFSELSIPNQKAMINKVYTQLANFPNCTGVSIASKFVGRKRDGKWMWVPADGYDVVFVYD